MKPEFIILASEITLLITRLLFPMAEPFVLVAEIALLGIKTYLALR